MNKIQTAILYTMLTLVACAWGGHSNPLHAQQKEKKKVTVSGSLEAYTAYMWRGSRECGAHAVPCLTLQWGGLTLQSYGFISFDGTYKEIDWDLSYTVGDFSFHLADYYARLSSYETPENYFSFKKGETDHIQEAIICYQPEKLPFAVRWFTFLHGNWIPNPDGSLGRPSFSSYLEAEVFHDFTEDNNRLSLLCGASVFKGVFTDYTRNFAVVDLELRYRYSLSLGRVKMPLNLAYIINPYRKTSWLNAGVGIEF